MTDQPEKLDLHSMNISEERKKELLRLFPEIRTEGGQIDFDRLKLTLGELIDVGRALRDELAWKSRMESLEKLWDAWERVKTLEKPSDKRKSADKLLNLVTAENKFRQMIGEEAIDLIIG